MTESRERPNMPPFLRGGGDAAIRIDAIDWSTSSLGPIEGWSDVLKTTLGILLHSHHPMFLWWGPDLIQFYNDAYAPSLGAGKHPKAMGQRGEECWPEAWPVIGPKVRGVMDRGVATWTENQLVPTLRNGRLEDVYWTYSYSPVVDHGGAVVGALVVCTETTRQVRVQTELQALADANRLLFELIPQQVWTSTADGALDFVNPRVIAYFASTQEAILGAGWKDVIHPDELPAVVERWTHCLQTGDPYEIEFRLKRGDGTYRWHLGRALAMRDPHGQIVKWFGTNTDIDDYKQIREELKKRAEFEQYMVGIVSHDLRNPLNVISLGTNVLAQNETLDAGGAKVVLRMQGAANRSARMIRDLLDFTQARLGGGLPVDLRTADVHTIAADVVEEVRAAHPQREVTFSAEGDGDGVWDSDRVAQIVANLLSNAIHHGARDAPVHLRTHGHDAHVVIEVHNLGDVIPEATLPSLFQPLKRGVGAHDRTTRSIGLGLFIVRELVQAHGGKVVVRSTTEAGTTFSVELPRRPKANA